MAKSIALSPVREDQGTGRSGLARDPENGFTTECKGQMKEEEERIPQDHVLAYPGRPPLLLVLILFFLSLCVCV